MTTIPVVFSRDRFTWLAYLMLAYYAYLQSSLGPLMPFLGDELDLSYTVRAFHLSAFALGMILAGLTADAAARRFGRQRVFWAGGGLMALAAVFLTIFRSPPLTIGTSLAMGCLGSYLLVMLQAGLSDRHQSYRATALTEANVASSITAALAPVLISQTEGLGLGWRTAILIGASAWVLLAFTFSREHIPQQTPAAQGAASGNGRLPRTFWLYWLVIVCSVAIEWCMVFWGAEFLNQVVGLTKVDASGTMAVFLIAMVIGRAGGSFLTRRITPTRLLSGAIVLVLVAFPAFWLTTEPPLSIAGLFFAGLGVANLFPMTLAAASNAAAAQITKVSARISLAGGIAILVVPQVLGSAADQIGIHAAFGIAGALIVGTLILILTANRAAARANVTTSGVLSKD